MLFRNSQYFGKISTLSNKKVIYNKAFLGVFLPLLFLYQPTFALSIKEMFSGFVESISLVNADKNNDRELRNENIQNLRVFEPDKNVKAAAIENMAPIKQMNNDDDLTLDPDKDNFFVGESFEKEDEHVHSDNAIYRVQKGESIYSIASYFSISPETILGFNKISERDVFTGVILEIPPVDGVYYSIQKGDTLRKLAEKYNVDLDDITLFNGLIENETLAAGEEIFIPGVKPEKKEKTKNQKQPVKTLDKNKNLAKNNINTQTIIDPVLGNLSKYIKNFGRGSTAQRNKLSDLKKYASLPKYPGYYIMPAPNTNRTQTMHGHNGSDFAGKTGSPVLASANGTVRVAKSSGYNFGYGNYIIISHPNGTETVYAHLSSVNVSVGQQVSQGQQIGGIGSSGNSTGPHLHFEIRGAYNPWAW